MWLSSRQVHTPHLHSHHTQSSGRRWGASRLPPAAEGRRRATSARRRCASEQPPEGRHLASRSGRGRCATQLRRQQGAHRAPQQVNIFAPTPKMKPSACVNLGPINLSSVFSRTDADLFFEGGWKIIDVRKTAQLCNSVNWQVAGAQ